MVFVNVVCCFEFLNDLNSAVYMSVNNYAASEVTCMVSSGKLNLTQHRHYIQLM